MSPIRSAVLSLVLSVPLLSAPLAPAMAEEVVLRGVSCFGIGSPPSASFEAVVAEINARGKGVVRIDLLGGAPAIGSPFQVVERMALGAYDIAGCPEAFFGNVVPEGPVLRLQERSFAELRQNGAIDYIQSLMNAKGIYYVGRHSTDGQFHLYLSKPIDKPDLTGLNLRVSPAYSAFFEKMGAAGLRASMAEVYTLMENGSVDGYGFSFLGFSPSWYPVTKYRVDPGFYDASIHTVMNLARRQSLSDEAKAVIDAVVLEAEAKVELSGPYVKAATEKMLADQAANGIQTSTFEGADAETWLNAAKATAWEEFLLANPETGPKLCELFTVSQ